MKRTKRDDDLIRKFLNEETEEGEDTETEDEPTAAEAAAEEAGEEIEEETDETAEGEEVRSSVVDTEIEAVLIDFETEARKEKSEETQALQSETRVYRKGLKYLLEQETEETAGFDKEIDISVFASELARLIKNYDNLLDMESIIMTKASDFIEKKYGIEAVTVMKDDLALKHDLDLEEKSRGLDSDSEVPNAVGAASGAAVGE